MLRDVRERIGKSYLVAKDEPFKGHLLGRFIRKDGPDEVARVIADPQLIAKGGCGVSGQWAYVPRIGLFDPAITDGAQRGFYIVYLFSADMERRLRLVGLVAHRTPQSRSNYLVHPRKAQHRPIA